MWSLKRSRSKVGCFTSFRYFLFFAATLPNVHNRPHSCSSLTDTAECVEERCAPLEGIVFKMKGVLNSIVVLEGIQNETDDEDYNDTDGDNVDDDNGKHFPFIRRAHTHTML